MPRTSTPIWYWTLLLLVGVPILNAIFWFASNQASAPRPEGSSSVADMVQLAIFALGYAPVFLGITWFCVRRYNPNTRLLAWRSDRPERSAVATLLFGGAAAFCLYGIVIILTSGEPWYGMSELSLFGLLIPWLLMLRAALIEQQSPASPTPHPEPLTLAFAHLALIICLVGAASAWLLLTSGMFAAVIAQMESGGSPADEHILKNRLYWDLFATANRLAVLILFGSGAWAAARFAKSPSAKFFATGMLLLLAVLTVIACFNWPPLFY